jgi:hypothetical protein
MGKIIAAVVASLVMCLFVPGDSAYAAGKQDFTLINHTGYQINKVFVSPASSNSWQEDVLGRDVLNNGKNVNIRFHRNTPGCKWDLKVVYTDDGSSAIWRGFDICAISKITIKYNRKTNVTSASVQ